MNIQPIHIETSGPGIDLSHAPSGLSIDMSDPVQDFEYARNAVTLTYDLTAYEQLRLTFEAKEYGDEPHAPPPNPFAGDANFDGVAISADGVDWYEVQDLRHLRSDRFTSYELDLDAAIAQWGLSYSSAFRIRFCQYDNNPALMDGIFIRNIELTGEFPGLYIHLPMDDNAADSTVHDASPALRHQTFIDPGGNPNTAAHSVSGVIASALQFDGVDDRIDFGADFAIDLFAEGHDFTIAVWIQNPTAVSDVVYALSKHTIEIKYEPSNGGRTVMQLYNGTVNRFLIMPGTLDGSFHHYTIMRQGTTIEHWYDGIKRYANTNPDNDGDFSNPTESMRLGMRHNGWGPYQGAVDDFRVYDRALTPDEIQTLFNMRADG
ncbi:LamG domain-containing protein [Candidatus Sumerlaeota bacterium]|nr:LamG domain-containing protein [Candidatus Sumerlaeota bacterium]